MEKTTDLQVFIGLTVGVSIWGFIVIFIMKWLEN